MTTDVSDTFVATAAELVDANHILVAQGVLDAFGHVSVRNPDDPETFLISRNLAPAQVQVEDIQVIGFDGTSSDGRRPYLERFLHGAVYRSRPDVQAIVHSHSASVVPFSISSTSLRAVWHMAGFLGTQVPVFEIRDTTGTGSDLLVRDIELGAALADSLGNAAVVLMRGHGSVAVGANLPQAVARAVYTELNARAQAAAAQLGEYTQLTAEEGAAAAASNDGQIRRAWDVWKAEVQDARASQRTS
nr:class II aldolase/adducin family protein [Microbacterium bovistercoris]